MVPEGRITDAGLIVWQMQGEASNQGMEREMDACFLDRAPTFETMDENRVHHVVNGGTSDLRAFTGTLWTEPRLKTRPNLIWPSRSLLMNNGFMPGVELTLVVQAGGNSKLSTTPSLRDAQPSLGYLTLLEIHPAYYTDHELTIVEHNAATDPKVATGGIYGRKGYIDEHVDAILIPAAILKNPAYVTALFTLEVTNPFAAIPGDAGSP
jgi:hypothetical protein